MPPQTPPGFSNPFRPGAGHPPPYLAGRDEEKGEFARLLEQTAILENLILTGLRGVGKTVLLEQLKPIAMDEGWYWVGADLSESTTVSESSLATRILTDVSVITSDRVVATEEVRSIGFDASPRELQTRLTFDVLAEAFDTTPGLVSDKLKAVLRLAWLALRDANGCRGVVFAYDEAQNMSDHAAKEQYPLSLLLDVFQSVQRQDIPFMLALTGLPTLFPKLVEARTFSERMFRVVFLDRLSEADSRDAVLKPISDARCPVRLNEDSVVTIVQMSGGYPYFIQFICREVYDSVVRGRHSVPVEEITRKLDSDFFAGRWARATDRQRELMSVIARLPNCDAEFTVQEIVELSKELLDKPFGSSHANQMLASLGKAGLVYKNRYGKYSFAVPLLDRFIRRQMGRSSPG